MNCFTYNDAENNQRLTVMHTFITDRNFNSDLRLPVNQKFEIGVNFRIGGVIVMWYGLRNISKMVIAPPNLPNLFPIATIPFDQ